MKRILLLLPFTIAVTTFMSFSGDNPGTHSSGNGAPAGVAGDPAASGANCTGCHAGPAAGVLNGVITSNIPPSGYIAGATYTITATIVRPGHSKFGFEITPQTSGGSYRGTLANISGTQIVGGAVKYITHTVGSTAGSGSRTWSFAWTAPAAGLGPVTFYGAFNATNANNNDTGDSIFISTLPVTENPASIVDHENDNFSLSAFPNPASDHVNVKFNISGSSPATMDIIDINGNVVQNLFSEQVLAGEVTRSADIGSFPQGVYFIRLNVDGNSSFYKLLKL